MDLAASHFGTKTCHCTIAGHEEKTHHRGHRDHREEYFRYSLRPLWPLWRGVPWRAALPQGESQDFSSTRKRGPCSRVTPSVTMHWLVAHGQTCGTATRVAE